MLRGTIKKKKKFPLFYSGYLPLAELSFLQYSGKVKFSAESEWNLLDYRKYARTDAIRRRRRRSFQRFCFFLLLALLLMGLAAIITWIIEAITGSGDSSSLAGTSSSLISSSISQPASGSESEGDSTAQGVVLPEKGRVELSYFADAAFVGDSITVGWNDYKGAAALPDTNVIAAIGATPPTDGVQWKDDAGELYDPLAKIVEANPSKIYLMFGANALVADGEFVEDNLVESYGTFIDDLQQKLPDAVIYIQSILTPTAAGTESHAGLTPERIARVNERLKSLAEEKGCWYLDLEENLCPDGMLSADYASDDGLHLNKEGYMAWLEYLITHAAYDPENPYVGGIDPGA